VVWGGYGYGNTGDDLVLAVALADLHQQHGDKLQVLSPCPAQTRLSAGDTEVILHPSGLPPRVFEKWFWRMTYYAEARRMRTLADALYRVALMHPERITGDPAWLKSLAAASQLHLAGGGYLAERFDLRHFLRPLRLARARHLPITTSPLGLGPFWERTKAVAVAEALRGARLVVRDETSLQFCQTHELAAVERPDDGFRWRQVIEQPTTKLTTARKNIIGICIFPQYSSLWSDAVELWWMTCLQALTSALSGYQLEGFCFHTGVAMDYEITRRLFSRAGLNPENVQPPQPDFRSAVLSLRRYDAILSTRFHAIVTASGMQIPCVAIAVGDYYETKMRGALKHAPAPLSLLNPLRDPPRVAAGWLVEQLHHNG